ncbi:hypothetical protein STAFG_8478 [Streptomyces afghaniensis 772]|uniref:SGNH hydrolase-type esterase domain-containing protein n=1 Tax=Streptomyces afghaniensis 772 TaxID=1283301 RepID=S4MM03_9ACTN|nr:hypothetical protein STAFG_8478 [Streptomyces afghaniensis 772]
MPPAYGLPVIREVRSLAVEIGRRSVRGKHWVYGFEEVARRMTSMSRARVARRIAAGAAYGGGGIGLAGAAAVGLVLAEVQLARRRVGNGTSPHVPNADGLYGRTYTVPTDAPLRLTMLGDSTAAGQGVHRAGQTPGALLASGLAALAERPVELRTVATPGARSDDLDRQVALVLADPDVPDICVIMVGANDVTHRMPPTRSVRHLSAAVRRLRTAGAEVVVGTCPDLGTIEPVQQPLRWLARRASRQLAAPRRSESSNRAAARCHWATCWVPSSPRTRASCSARTATTPRPRATRRRRWRSCRPSAPPSACGRPRRSARTPPAARASCRWPGRRRRPRRRLVRRSRPPCRAARGDRGRC